MNTKFKERFIKSTIILIIGGLLTKVLGMLIKIISTKAIGSYGIGLYMMILPTFNLFITIATLSLPTSISKLVAENTKNNKLDNLELISQIDNLNYGTRNKRISETNSKINSAFQTKQSKKINCYLYPSMDFVKEFHSTKEVEMELGIYHSHVSKCCKNIYKQIQGYTFRYV